jgi:hypothetical protein
MKNKDSGPYVLMDGLKTDARLWEAEMDQQSEDAFDQYMYIKALNEAAVNELERRERKEKNKKKIYKG